MGISKRLNVGTQLTVGVNRTTPLSAFEVVGTNGINITDGGASASVKQLNLNYDTTNNRSNMLSINQGVALTDIYCQCNNFGINGTTFGGGGNCFFLGYGTAPTSNPTNGFIIYCNSTGMYGRSPAGTITKFLNP